VRADKSWLRFCNWNRRFAISSLGCADFANSPDCHRQLAKRRNQQLPRRIYESTKTLAAQFAPQPFTFHTGSVPDGGSTVSLLGFASLGLSFGSLQPPMCIRMYRALRRHAFCPVVVVPSHPKIRLAKLPKRGRRKTRAMTSPRRQPRKQDSLRRASEVMGRIVPNYSAFRKWNRFSVSCRLRYSGAGLTASVNEVLVATVGL